DLPKNLEGYYQETGRAGRDGLPSDCLLLFGYGDKMKIEYFIDQKPGEHERRIAYQQLQQIVGYAESADCRRRIVLDYFGETLATDNCGMCDNCTSATPVEKFDATIPAQQFLSCVKRTGERFGMNYVIDVLRGAKAEKIFINGHATLSTYGIGNGYSKEEWQAMVRQLIRLGYARQASEEYNAIKLTEKSREVLFNGEKLFLNKPKQEQQFVSADERSADQYDHELFERLRELRKNLAQQAGLPAYMIFSDASLRQMAQKFPITESAFKNITGVGERKLAQYGEIFIQEISTHCRGKNINPFSTSASPATNAASMNQAKVIRKATSPTQKETLLLHREGLSVERIAERRHLAVNTIFGHLAGLISQGEAVNL
ncbi:HRDC domain-containing protein, partial [candidate division KSB1 bacterium]|nr:HRDC domain-containing protein [candidate division KSB1 bacterium]